MVSKMLCGLGAAWLVAGAPLDASPTLFHGGTIVALDGTTGQHDAMLIDQDLVVAVGRYQELKQAHPKARKVALQGRTIIPGIIDSHVHVAELGASSLYADVSEAQSVEDMIKALRAFYPKPKPGSWLIGQGWDEGVWGSRGYPDRQLLDQAFPQNPVKLDSRHGFAAFYNRAALLQAGIDAKTPNPEGGTILRRADGEATGVLLTLAKKLVEPHVPPLTQEQEEQAIIKGLELMASEGVTSVHEAGINRKRLPAWENLARQGKLPIRVYGLLDGNDGLIVAKWTERGPFESDFFTVRGFKVFYDGSLGSRTALLAKPYSDRPQDAKMTERISIEAIRSLADRASPKGFQLAVHTIGDAANHKIIDVYREVRKKFPNRDLRWRLEHAQVLDPEAIREISDLGLIASMQPSHAVGDSKWAEERLGSERIRHAYAWRSLLDAKVRVMLNSDLPGEPWTPRETLYFAVTRKTLDGQPPLGWYPNQSLTAAEALAGMTKEGAYGAFAETRLGQLKPGFQADFVIMDRNPLTVPADQLKSLKVIETWVDGKPVKKTVAQAS
jgi:predicted amidohydrolase YtcJ